MNFQQSCGHFKRGGNIEYGFLFSIYDGKKVHVLMTRMDLFII